MAARLRGSRREDSSPRATDGLTLRGMPFVSPCRRPRTRRGRGRADPSRNRESAGVSSRIQPSSRPRAAGMPWRTTASQRGAAGGRRRRRRSSARSPRCSRMSGLDVCREDAAGGELVAVARTRGGTARGRTGRAACSTASSNGRCSKAWSVLWWMKMLIGPWAGSRCARRSSRAPGSSAAARRPSRAPRS